MLSNFKVRLLIFLYGGFILEALMLDELLSSFKSRGMLQYSFGRIPTDSEKDLIRNLGFLVEEKYINAYSDEHYDITQKGALHLAHGGFLSEAKKSKNALYAFRISLISIIIALISILVTLANWFSRID